MRAIKYYDPMACGIDASDEGSYSCVAENVLGQTHQVAFLVVSCSQRLTLSLVIIVTIEFLG